MSDHDAARAGLTRWLAARWPDAGALEIASMTRAPTGLSSDTLFVDVAWHGGGRALVVRVAPGDDGLFPAPDLAAQAHTQAALAAAGVPTAPVVAVEEDPAVFGAPFLVMERVRGRTVRNDTPYLRTGWLAELDPPAQTELFDRFLQALAALHAVDWRAAGLAGLARPGASEGGGAIVAELDWWSDYLRWAGPDRAPDSLHAALAWCRADPPSEPAASFLWGDAHLGNVVVDDEGAPAALLDFELAVIGPAELDVGWFLALHAMTVERCGVDAPGFPDRAGMVARYEELLGRALIGLEWHETFAAVRTGAILVRMAALLERAGVDDGWLRTANPTTVYLERRLS